MSITKKLCGELMILDNFDDESNVNCKRYILTTTINQTNGKKETVETPDITFTAFKYTVSASTRYFNSKFNADVNDVLILEPNYALKESDNISVTDNRGTFKYIVDSIEDVGSQGEVMLIGIKRI